MAEKASYSRLDAEGCLKYPIKRLEPTIQKFIKIFQIDLERLEHHRQNIIKFQELGQWNSLKREHINSTRTVQQLKASLRELERTRNQVNDDELSQFDAKVRGIREDAMEKIMEFISMNSVSSHSHDNLVTKTKSHPLEDDSPTVSEPEMSRDEQLQQMILDQKMHHELEDSWGTLYNDIEDLNGMMTELNRQVHAQGEMIDTIEDNVTKADENVTKGNKYLGQAARYKAALYPVAGALIGGVIGGPIGLVAGLKIGVASAVGGGILGITGGTLLKKHKQKNVNYEMVELNKRTSASMPTDLEKLK